MFDDATPHPFVQLASHAIRAYLTTGETITPPESLLQAVPQARQPGAAFVCLKIEDRLRGCVGSIQAARDTLADEIIQNAIGAASRDHRFSPVSSVELDRLEVSVDVLGAFEPIAPQPSDWPQLLDPEAFGVLVRAGERQGILLPGIPGIVAAAAQVAIAREKAGIGPHESIELFRFRVTRYR